MPGQLGVMKERTKLFLSKYPCRWLLHQPYNYSDIDTYFPVIRIKDKEREIWFDDFIATFLNW